MSQILAAALVAAALLAPSVAVATHQPGPEVDQALAYLRARQGADGRIGNDASTAWAAIAFARAGGLDPAMVRAGGASLEQAVIAATQPSQSVLSLARQVLAMAASGADPRSAAGFDAVAEIYDAWDGAQLGNPAIFNDDVFGLQALHAAGVPDDDPVVQGVRGYLLDQQQLTGAWSYAPFNAANPDVFPLLFADVDTTSQVMVALLATGSASSDLAIVRATVFMKLAQGVFDGGCSWSPVAIPFNALADPTQPFLSNTYSTSWGVMGLVAAGQDPAGLLWTAPSGETLLSYLAAMQQPDGSFLYQPGVAGFEPESLAAFGALALAEHTFLG
ncbi:MAG TPA: prenyltransferase/squalene oxidase repeat-containing protein [Candidatus Thermoplasmatota archaeon]|jgi:hypothetical protein|nr:prenyltransferase/squalene oxidase repeat-containing protein [Candidatus Thermoplasmatota archaeon]